MITGSVCPSLSLPLKTWGAIGQILHLQRVLCSIWEFWINQGLSGGERCSCSAHRGKVFSMRTDKNLEFQLEKESSRCEVGNWRCSKDMEGRGDHRHREGRLWDNCSGWVMRRGTWLIHRKLEFSISFFPEPPAVFFGRLSAFSWQRSLQTWAAQKRKHRTVKISTTYLFLECKTICYNFQHCFFTGIHICPRHFAFFPHIFLLDFISLVFKTLSQVAENINFCFSDSFHLRRLSSLNCVACQLFPFSLSVAAGADTPWIMKMLWSWVWQMGIRTWEIRQVSLDRRNNKVLICWKWSSFCGKISEKDIISEHVYCCD